MIIAIAILGILKAGAAYVPLDPEYPTDRLDYMIKGSNLSLIIPHQYIAKKVKISTKLYHNQLKEILRIP